MSTDEQRRATLRALYILRSLRDGVPASALGLTERELAILRAALEQHPARQVPRW